MFHISQRKIQWLLGKYWLCARRLNSGVSCWVSLDELEDLLIILLSPPNHIRQIKKSKAKIESRLVTVFKMAAPSSEIITLDDSCCSSPIALRPTKAANELFLRLASLNSFFPLLLLLPLLLHFYLKQQRQLIQQHLLFWTPFLANRCHRGQQSELKSYNSQEANSSTYNLVNKDIQRVKSKETEYNLPPGKSNDDDKLKRIETINLKSSSFEISLKQELSSQDNELQAIIGRAPVNGKKSQQRQFAISPKCKSSKLLLPLSTLLLVLALQCQQNAPICSAFSNFERFDDSDLVNLNLVS